MPLSSAKPVPPASYGGNARPRWLPEPLNAATSGGGTAKCKPPRQLFQDVPGSGFPADGTAERDAGGPFARRFRSRQGIDHEGHEIPDFKSGFLIGKGHFGEKPPPALVVGGMVVRFRRRQSGRIPTRASPHQLDQGFDPAPID